MKGDVIMNRMFLCVVLSGIYILMLASGLYSADTTEERELSPAERDSLLFQHPDNMISVLFNNKENANIEWDFADSFGVRDTTYLLDSGSVDVVTSDNKVSTAHIKYRSIVHDSIMVEYFGYKMVNGDQSNYAVYPKFRLIFERFSSAYTLNYSEVLRTELLRLGDLLGDKKPFTEGMLDTMFNESLGCGVVKKGAFYCVNPGFNLGYALHIVAADSSLAANSDDLRLTCADVCDTTICYLAWIADGYPAWPSVDLPDHIQTIEDYTGIKGYSPSYQAPEPNRNSGSSSIRVVSPGNMIKRPDSFYKVYDFAGRLVSNKLSGVGVSDLIKRTGNCYILFSINTPED